MGVKVAVAVAAMCMCIAAAAPTTTQARWTYQPSGAQVVNPSRGFRHQIDGFCGLPSSDGHSSRDPTGAASVKAGIEVCHQLNMTVALSYCYLSPFWNTSLPDSMLANLDSRLGDMRVAGVSALFNFGYEDGKTDFEDDVEPFTFDRIYAHIDQLAPVLLKNADVVYGLQAGFIGNAGEWAHDIRGLLNNSTGLAKMVQKLLYQAVPPDRPVLIRKGDEKLHLLRETKFAHCAGNPPVCSGVGARETGDGADGESGVAAPGWAAAAQENWRFGVVDSATVLSQAAFARLGHYNAAFQSTAGDGGTFYPDDMRNIWFQYFTREAPYVAVDGECYYGTPWPAKERLLVDGHAAAARFAEHSYNTFSHHNSYWPLDTEATPVPWNKSINVWYNTSLNYSFVKEQMLPMTEAYKNASLLRNGSVYEYIRDHLGYRLELSSAMATVTPAASAQHGPYPGGGTATHGSTANVDVQIAVEMLLQNNGVSAPVNIRAWHIALLSPSDGSKVAWRSPGITGADADVDWRLLYPYLPGDPVRQPLVHNVTLTATATNLPAGRYDVGVTLVDPHAMGGVETAENTAVQFTNPLRWQHGVNVLGSVTL